MVIPKYKYPKLTTEALEWENEKKNVSSLFCHFNMNQIGHSE